MSCFGLNIFADYNTHLLCGKLKAFNLDESNIFDLKRQLYHVFMNFKKNNLNIKQHLKINMASFFLKKL